MLRNPTLTRIRYQGS